MSTRNGGMCAPVAGLAAALLMACVPGDEPDLVEQDSRAFHEEYGDCRGQYGTQFYDSGTYAFVSPERAAVFTSYHQVAGGVTVVIDDGHGGCWDPYAEAQDPTRWQSAHPSCRWYSASFPVYCNGVRGGIVRVQSEAGGTALVASGSACDGQQIGWIDPWAAATRDQVKRAVLAPGWAVYRGASGHPAFVYMGASCGAPTYCYKGSACEWQGQGSCAGGTDCYY